MRDKEEKFRKLRKAFEDQAQLDEFTFSVVRPVLDKQIHKRKRFAAAHQTGGVLSAHRVALLLPEKRRSPRKHREGQVERLLSSGERQTHAGTAR